MKKILPPLLVNLALLILLEAVFWLPPLRLENTIFIPGKKPGTRTTNFKVFDPRGLDMVDPETFTEKKAPGTYRIFFLGESTVAGFHYNPEISMTKFMDQALQDLLPKRKV